MFLDTQQAIFVSELAQQPKITKMEENFELTEV
jgi:hypothetical protein